MHAPSLSRGATGCHGVFPCPSGLFAPGFAEQFSRQVAVCRRANRLAVMPGSARRPVVDSKETQSQLREQRRPSR